MVTYLRFFVFLNNYLQILLGKQSIRPGCEKVNVNVGRRSANDSYRIAPFTIFTIYIPTERPCQGLHCLPHILQFLDTLRKHIYSNI